MKKQTCTLTALILIFLVTTLISCEDQVIECPADGTHPYKYLSVEALKQQVKNYGEDNWMKTSNYYSNLSLSTTDPAQKIPLNRLGITELYKQDNFAVSNTVENFDARFADINIDELEDYLCTIKNHPEASSINTIRVYYTKYNDNMVGEYASYSGKHSIALVPVIVTGEHEDGIEILTNIDNSAKTYIMNHNWICPPKKGWLNSNTILYQADNNL